MFKNITLVLLSSVLLVGSLSAKGPSVISLGSAINLCKKQEAYTQRIGQGFLMAATGHATAATERDINISIVLFEKGQEMLAEYAPTKALQEEVKRVSNLWTIYKSIVQSTPNVDNALTILSGNSQILEACQNVGAMLKDYASKQANASRNPLMTNAVLADNITKAGRLRVISYRYTMYYVAYYSDIMPKETLAECIKIADEFEVISNTLFTNNINDQEILDILSGIIAKLMPIRKRAAEILQGKAFTPEVLYTVSGEFIDLSEQLAAAFEKMLL